MTPLLEHVMSGKMSSKNNHRHSDAKTLDNG